MSAETGPTGGTSRRERRIQRLRLEIMDAAARLFAEKGFNATTTRDIAEAIDLGESTLYGYFPGKQDILLSILNRQAELVDSLLSEMTRLNDRQSFIDLVDLIMEKMISNLPYLQTLLAEAWVNDEILNNIVIGRLKHITDFLESFITERIAAGDFRRVDPGLTARILLAIWAGALLPALRGVEPPPSPDRCRQLSEAIINLVFDGLVIQSRP